MLRRRRLKLFVLCSVRGVWRASCSRSSARTRSSSGAAGAATIDKPADAPHAQAAIVLGAQVKPDGTPSRMLADRLRVAAELYKRGKVDKVLVSGDHGRVGYDEVNPMKDALLAAGVPESDIFTDHAGFDTWDTMVRAKKVFQVDSALVVTQDFHLPRAVFLARRAGARRAWRLVRAAGLRPRAARSDVREVVARVKGLAEGIVRRQPRFLGPAIPITGDGRASKG